MTPTDDDVDKIVEAYTHTRMTVEKFESFVRQVIVDAEARGAQSGAGGRTYDEGFDEGWDSCLREHGLEEP